MQKIKNTGGNFECYTNKHSDKTHSFYSKIIGHKCTVSLSRELNSIRFMLLEAKSHEILGSVLASSKNLSESNTTLYNCHCGFNTISALWYDNSPVPPINCLMIIMNRLDQLPHVQCYILPEWVQKLHKWITLFIRRLKFQIAWVQPKRIPTIAHSITGLHKIWKHL